MAKVAVIFSLEAINIDDAGFYWKDRLIITNGKRKCPGVALAAVNVDEREAESETIADAHHFLNLFLSCYHLINAQSPSILPGHESFQLKPGASFTDLVNSQPIPLEYASRAPSYPEAQARREIESAVPTFDKIMAVVDSNKVPALETALVMYRRAVSTMESLEDFISIVTALEALFSDGNSELTYKLSLRTAIMLKEKMGNSRLIFDEVKKIYDKRSKLVHVSIIPKSFRKELIPLKMKAETYAHYCLIEYIELAAKGMTKDDITKMLDDKALGVFEKP